MKIFFSPEYSGAVFVRPSDANEVMMDQVVVNTAGLVDMLELRLGLHHEDISVHERVAYYYEALSKYLAENPSDVMAKSFADAGLSTAKAMLKWRDELRGAGWNFTGADISPRMAALVGVEEYFRKKVGTDFADRLREVTEQVRSQKLICCGLTIEIPVDKAVLKPAIKDLLAALEQQGAQIDVAQKATSTGNNLSCVRDMVEQKQKGKITLDKDDDSIQVWQFADDRLACEYLSYNDMTAVDAWVNADNKQMDNWLMLMNKAQTGSVTAECVPQLTQLFVMGIGMFANPLNVSTLIEWLNMPLNPMNGYFRTVLANTIVSEGGYRNDACKEVVKDYLDGKFVYLDDEQKALPEEEQEEIRKKGRKSRQEKVDVYLPTFERNDSILRERVRKFVDSLSSWSRQRVILMADREGNDQRAEQLLAVAGMCDAFHILLNTVTSDTIDYKTLDSWMSNIYQKGSFTNAIAEKGCRVVMDSPAKIASVAQTTVWIGVDGDTSKSQECDFLYPTERARLIESNAIRPWSEEDQNTYNEQMLMTPLRMTSGKLILVVRERLNGEVPQKHPLIVRLERKVENYEDIVRTPKVLEADRHQVDMIGGDGLPQEMSFDHKDKIKWPDHLSPTAIENLVEYPLDYLMENLLCIVNEGKAQMSDVKTTKGNVAHAVIEALFAPRDGESCSTPDEIARRIRDEYEPVYQDVIEAKGALLQLAENKLEGKLLFEQLRKCLDSLLGILRDNNLKVTGCEHFVEGIMGFSLPKPEEEADNAEYRDILGYIDMTLEDAAGNPVVFDFKWTSWAKGYQNKLTENRSVQLEFYRHLLGREFNKGVNRVAYFLMPEGRLYSQETFNGKNCVQLTPENTDDIVAQLIKAVRYRMKQLNDGVVETGGQADELQYVKDTAAEGLFPLKQDKETGERENNHFTKYELFNR